MQIKFTLIYDEYEFTKYISKNKQKNEKKV